MNARKYCLLNIKKRQVRVKLLVGPREKFSGEDLTSEWPQNVTVEVVNTPYLTAAQKIAYYYTQLTDDEITSAKWHAKIDDDTLNDVSHLMWHLEDEFDYNDKNYIVTELKIELEDVERNILTKMGFDRWNHNEIIKHEFEGCFVSQAAMKAIKENEKAQEYLGYRVVNSDGYGDQPVGIALKFCKTFAIDSRFLSPFGELNNFSLFGGRLAHLHFFSGRSKDHAECYDFATSMINCSEKNQELKNQIIYNKYICNSNPEQRATIYFEQNNKFIWEHINGEDKRSGLWSVYKDMVLGLAFDEGGEGGEHSSIYELFPAKDQLNKFNCLKNNKYSIDGFVKSRITKFL